MFNSAETEVASTTVNSAETELATAFKSTISCSISPLSCEARIVCGTDSLAETRTKSESKTVSELMLGCAVCCVDKQTLESISLAIIIYSMEILD